MASLDRACRAIADDLRLLSGLTYAMDRVAEDQTSANPIVTVYPVAGFWRLGTASGGSLERAMRWGTHTVRVRVSVPWRDTERDMDDLMPFGESIPAALFSGYVRDRFGGTVVCIGDPEQRGGTPPLRYEFGPTGTETEPKLSWTFSLDITVEEEIEE